MSAASKVTTVARGVFNGLGHVVGKGRDMAQGGAVHNGWDAGEHVAAVFKGAAKGTGVENPGIATTAALMGGGLVAKKLGLFPADPAKSVAQGKQPAQNLEKNNPMQM